MVWLGFRRSGFTRYHNNFPEILVKEAKHPDALRIALLFCDARILANALEFELPI
ncbi:MAG: hypothetical protein NTY26_17025 [Burkholderiales bacterium]|nr:hypothetical protein [Burkholderiales bacterium]